MNQAQIQARANAACGKASGFLGAPVSVFRADAGQALVPALDASHLVAQVSAWFNPDQAFRGTRPAAAEQPVAHALLDRTAILAGDYLVGGDGTTWFVGSLQPLLATPCVRCNRAFTLMRAEPATGPAAYGGNAPGNMTTLLSAWPGFVSSKPRGLTPEERVPGDTKLNVVTLLLPGTGSVEIVANDVLIDDQADPTRYTVSLATATDWGWGVQAYYAGA